MVLGDLTESFNDSKDEEYLLGQIIVCPSEDPDKALSSKYEQWDLIDGQQRCTTLYLMLLAMYKRMGLLAKTDDDLKAREVSELHVLSTHRLDNKTEWPKIRPASNGIQILEALVNDLDLPDVQGPTASNLLSAWSQINEFLEELNVEIFEDFVEYFQKKVVLIRLELDEAKHALRVFSKVNNRGLTLDDSDLIKNFLFQKVSNNDEFEKLASYWDKAANTLYSSRLKKTQTMDFLLKLKAGIQTGQSISSSKIFDTWSSALSTEDAVKEFARKLPDDAQTVQELSVNSVRQSNGYSDWNYFTGLRKVVQHFEILLAGSHLTPDAYAPLNRMVQDRTTLAVLSKTEKEFERLVHPWAQKVQRLDSNANLKEVIQAAKEAEALSNLDELFQIAFLKIQSLRYTTQSHQETLRYLLARSSKIVQESIESNEKMLKDYMQTTSSKKSQVRGYDLDHIFPKSKNQFQIHWPKSGDWDGLEEEERNNKENRLIHSIGNLVLLHPKDNRDQSDSLPWDSEKQYNFENSEIYLNRSLSINAVARLSKNHEEILKGLGLSDMPKLQDWDEEAVEKRAKIIWGIIERDMKNSFRLRD